MCNTLVNKWISEKELSLLIFIKAHGQQGNAGFLAVDHHWINRSQAKWKRMWGCLG